MDNSLNSRRIKASRRLARRAGLRYVSDEEAGIVRVRSGGGFSFRYCSGRPVLAKGHLLRIDQLGIPPAWTNVWICRFANGHLQSTGRDTRSRKQYIYHAQWRTMAECAKSERLLEFARILPQIRRRVAQDLRRRSLSCAKVTALVVHLLDRTAIRVGNAEYARDNESYGLTTLRKEHAEIIGSRVTFDFEGKSGKRQYVQLRNRRLAGLIKRCAELPGDLLFQYVDTDGVPRPVSSQDVNSYLHEVSEDITAKDFRTWHATVCAVGELSREEAPESRASAKRRLKAAVAQAADLLGNTPTVCRKHYVHAGIAESFLSGELVKNLRTFKSRTTPSYTQMERLTLHLLERTTPKTRRRWRREKSNGCSA